MPGMTGLETLSQIKSINADVPVVMITKSEEEHIMEEAIASKIADYLIKPINPNQILLSIKQSVSRKAIIYLKKHNPKGLESIATGQKHSPYHFWQDGGGYDRNITSSHTIKNVVRYIHNNPVRRELVASAEQWYYSSAKD